MVCTKGIPIQDSNPMPQAKSKPWLTAGPGWNALPSTHLNEIINDKPHRWVGVVFRYILCFILSETKSRPGQLHFRQLNVWYTKTNNWCHRFFIWPFSADANFYPCATDADIDTKIIKTRCQRHKFLIHLFFWGAIEEIPTNKKFEKKETLYIIWHEISFFIPTYDYNEREIDSTICSDLALEKRYHKQASRQEGLQQQWNSHGTPEWLGIQTSWNFAEQRGEFGCQEFIYRLFDEAKWNEIISSLNYGLTGGRQRRVFIQRKYIPDQENSPTQSRTLLLQQTKWIERRSLEKTSRKYWKYQQ